jgi:hypothetical protein
MDHKFKNIARIVVLFWLAGWYIKLGFYGPYLLETTRQFPVLHPMFPAFFQNADVANLFYFLPAFLVPFLFFRRDIYLRISAVVMVVCAAVLNLHINTCNDATFVTSFWSALWLLWFICQKNPLPHAKMLAMCVLGMIFWGGFIGKLTPEYWNGQVMTQILIAGGDKTLLGKIVLPLSTVVRDNVMMWLGRLVIIIEGVLALSPLLPVRFVLFLLCVIVAGFCLFSTWTILSVLSSLVGLAVAVVRLEKICLDSHCRVQ